MRVRAKEQCYIDNRRRREGAEFDYYGAKLPKCLELIDATEYVAEEKPVEIVDPYAKLSDEEIKSRLFTYGVKFHHRAGRDSLLEKLREAEGA